MQILVLHRVYLFIVQVKKSSPHPEGRPRPDLVEVEVEDASSLATWTRNLQCFASFSASLLPCMLLSSAPPLLNQLLRASPCLALPFPTSFFLCHFLPFSSLLSFSLPSFLPLLLLLLLAALRSGTISHCPNLDSSAHHGYIIHTIRVIQLKALFARRVKIGIY